VVSVVGRLDPAKGHLELVEALPTLLRAVPDVTALLVGGDDVKRPGHRDLLLRRAQELSVAHAVRLLGHEPSAAVLAMSSAVCVPTVPHPDGSGREGFGLIAAEALALGVPVVAYDVGATAEVVGDCGLLVAPGDRAGLADGVVAALTDRQLAERLGDCGRRRAGELSLERMAEQMLGLYRGVAA
jgi:glycosyltransferase involved in cell wall biosynthesis